MDTKTLDALKASIAHWQENLIKAKAGEQFETGHFECALCELYWYEDCNGCPVKDKTGCTGCANTPYRDVRRAKLWRHPIDDLIAATHAEVEFLQSLLPPEKK